MKQFFVELYLNNIVFPCEFNKSIITRFETLRMYEDEEVKERDHQGSRRNLNKLSYEIILLLKEERDGVFKLFKIYAFNTKGLCIIIS